jgi:hypothetical protein
MGIDSIEQNKVVLGRHSKTLPWRGEDWEVTAHRRTPPYVFASHKRIPTFCSGDHHTSQGDQQGATPATEHVRQKNLAELENAVSNSRSGSGSNALPLLPWGGTPRCNVITMRSASNGERGHIAVGRLQQVCLATIFDNSRQQSAVRERLSKD